MRLEDIKTVRDIMDANYTGGFQAKPFVSEEGWRFEPGDEADAAESGKIVETLYSSSFERMEDDHPLRPTMVEVIASDGRSNFGLRKQTRCR